jgi:hypothetical protein
VLTAFALRVAVPHPHARLDAVPAVSLCLGSSVYLLGYVGLQLRVAHRVTLGRPTATLLFAAILPVALHVSRSPRSGSARASGARCTPTS